MLDEYAQPGDDAIPTVKQALARWLSVNLYVHEGEGDWHAYLDTANEILALIQRAENGVTRRRLVSAGEILIEYPDGRLDLVPANIPPALAPA